MVMNASNTDGYDNKLNYRKKRMMGKKREIDTHADSTEHSKDYIIHSKSLAKYYITITKKKEETATDCKLCINSDSSASIRTLYPVKRKSNAKCAVSIDFQ